MGEAARSQGSAGLIMTARKFGIRRGEEATGSLEGVSDAQSLVIAVTGWLLRRMFYGRHLS